MARFEGVELVQIMCTASGPGSAQLAGQWANAFGLTNVRVWGDTTDYMYNNFGSQVGGSYPSTMVIDLDTMVIEHFQLGRVDDVDSVINGILSEPNPCAEQ